MSRLSPVLMTAEERLAEVAEILATGIVRLRARELKARQSARRHVLDQHLGAGVEHD